LAFKKVWNADHSGAFVSPDFPRLQPGFRRYVMWLTLFCVVISISLGLALGAMVVDSYEENARP
jgi:hypothetical protein